MNNDVLGPTVNSGFYYGVLASLLQTNSAASGLYFDPVTAKQLIVSNAASDYVLRAVQVG